MWSHWAYLHVGCLYLRMSTRRVSGQKPQAKRETSNPGTIWHSNP